jgi:hypothetical protein
VSMLGGVQRLSLSHTDVFDVSALGNVSHLCLEATSVRDVSMLGDVPTLQLRGCEIEKHGRLSNVHDLDLSQNDNLKNSDINYLTNVRVLRLTCCHLDEFPIDLHNLHLLDFSFKNILYTKIPLAIHRAFATIVEQETKLLLDGIEQDEDCSYDDFIAYGFALWSVFGFIVILVFTVQNEFLIHIAIHIVRIVVFQIRGFVFNDGVAKSSPTAFGTL